MAVGRGSILRAADTVNKAENESKTTKEPKEPVKKSIHEEKFQVITSLKEDLPIYLL